MAAVAESTYLPAGPTDTRLPTGFWWHRNELVTNDSFTPRDFSPVICGYLATVLFGYLGAGQLDQKFGVTG